jgi:hypothetical protein
MYERLHERLCTDKYRVVWNEKLAKGRRHDCPSCPRKERPRRKGRLADLLEKGGRSGLIIEAPGKEPLAYWKEEGVANKWKARRFLKEGTMANLPQSYQKKGNG